MCRCRGERWHGPTGSSQRHFQGDPDKEQTAFALDYFINAWVSHSGRSLAHARDVMGRLSSISWVYQSALRPHVYGTYDTLARIWASYDHEGPWYVLTHELAHHYWWADHRDISAPDEDFETQAWIATTWRTMTAAWPQPIRYRWQPPDPSAPAANAGP